MELKDTGLIPAIKLENIFSKRLSAGALLLCLGLVAAGLIIHFTTGQAIGLALAKFLGGMALLDLIYFLFISRAQEQRKLSAEQVAEYLSSGRIEPLMDFNVAYLIQRSLSNGRINLKGFYQSLTKNRDFLWMLTRLNIDTADLAKHGQKYQNETISLNDLYSKAADIIRSYKLSSFDLGVMLAACLGLDGNFYGFIFAADIKDRDLLAVGGWLKNHKQKLSESYRFWDEASLTRVKGIGKGWSAGYTPNLDKIGYDITDQIRIKKPEYIYGHKQHIESIEGYLVDGSHNVVLVGSPGVGRHTIVRNLAALMNSGYVLGPLQYMRLVQIDSSAVLSTASAGGSNLDKIRLLFSEALWAGNVILVVNDIDAFFDPSPEVGRVNAAEALLPFLKSKLKVIGLTTQSGFQSTIGKNAELLRWFGKVEVTEPDADETLRILEDHVVAAERQTGLAFTYQALWEIVNLSTRLIQTLPNPEKSLEVLDSTAIYVRTKGLGNVVLPEHVQKVITERTKIPVEKIAGQEKDLLLNLENLLHERIVGQDEAVIQISNSLRRARSGIASSKRPIGSFMFLGPTGVGKTETTKALAAVYFGSEDRILRFDMSEFQEVKSISRFIGDSSTNTAGMLTEAVINNPFSVILLDEIEKANPKILDIFLQVLDEGRLTDSLNRTVDFTNTMIIATSNAGAELIRESLRSNKTVGSKDAVLDLIQKKGIFRPEFINRFDGVVVFKPLTQGELLRVAGLILKDFNRRLEDKEISVVITPELLEYVVKNAYSLEFGARPLRRFVADKIENYIATGLISGTIKRGQSITFTPEIISSL
jgi:ATP-dependent Clp protease ATP-binding subunit ClpC